MFAKAATQAFLAGRLVAEYTGLIDVKVHPSEPLVILNYTDLCAVARRWDEVTSVCRGLIVHRETGEVVALPFAKFFNLGECEETQPESLPDEPFIVYEKVDGSLGIFYRDTAGQPCLATRGSFTSQQAVKGTKMLRNMPSIADVPANLTLLFEIVYSDNRVVVDYGDVEELVLLGIFNRETGEELPWSEVLGWAAKLGVRTPIVYQFRSIQELLDAKANLSSSLEGFVIRFASGLRIKLKGDAYLELHKLALGINRSAILATLKIGVFDQYLQKTPEEFRGLVEEIAAEICALTQEYEAAVRGYFAQAPQGTDRKTFALWVKATVPAPFHAALFQLADAKIQPKWIVLATKGSR